MSNYVVRDRVVRDRVARRNYKKDRLTRQICGYDCVVELGLVPVFRPRSTTGL